MPSFDVEDIDIYPDEFVGRCGKTEIKELIDELVDRGHLPENVRNYVKIKEKYKGFHPSESIYEEAVAKLHGKYSNLTQEEEEMILKIANRL